MDDFLNDVRLNLRSEKANARKNGKKLFEELQSGKCSYIKVLNPKQTIYLIEAAATYQELEISAACARNKDPGIECANFFRSVIRYCIKNGTISAFHLVSIVNFVNVTINVMTNTQLSTLFRNVYKNVICDLLDLGWSHVFPFKLEKDNEERGTLLWFTFLRDTLVDKKTCSDPINIKLLKSLCGSLFHDMSGEAANSCLTILDWLNHMLATFAMVDTDESSLAIIAGISECFASIVKNHGPNIMNSVIPKLPSLFSVILRHLQNYQTRPVHIESFYNLLGAFVDLLLFHANDVEDSIVGLEVMEDSIQQLCLYFASDEFFVRVGSRWKLICQGKRSNSKDSGSMSDDKYTLSFYYLSAKYWLLLRKFFPLVLISMNSDRNNSLEERNSKKRRIETTVSINSTKVDLMEYLIRKIGSLDFASDRTSRIDIRKKQEPLFAILEGSMTVMQCYLALLIKLDMYSLDGIKLQLLRNATQSIDILESIIYLIDDKSAVSSMIDLLSLFTISFSRWGLAGTSFHSFFASLTNVLVKLNATHFRICKNEWYKLIFLLLKYGDLSNRENKFILDSMKFWDIQQSPDQEGLGGLWCFLFLGEISNTELGSLIMTNCIDIIQKQDLGLEFKVCNDRNMLSPHQSALLINLLYCGMKLCMLQSSQPVSKIKSGAAINLMLDKFTEFSSLSFFDGSSSVNVRSKNLSLQELFLEISPAVYYSWCNASLILPDDRQLINLRSWGTTSNIPAVRKILQTLDTVSQLWSYHIDNASAAADFHDAHLQLLEYGIVLGHLYCLCSKVVVVESDEQDQANQGNHRCFNSILKLILVKLSTATLKISEDILKSICHSMVTCEKPWHADMSTSKLLESILNWCMQDRTETLKRKTSQSHIEESLDFGNPSQENSRIENGDDFLTLCDSSKSFIQKDLSPLLVSVLELCTQSKIFSNQEMSAFIVRIDDNLKAKVGMGLLEFQGVPKFPAMLKLIFDHLLDINHMDPMEVCRLFKIFGKTLSVPSIWTAFQVSSEGEYIKAAFLDLIFHPENNNSLSHIWLARLGRFQCVITVLKAYHEAETLKDKLPSIFLESIQDCDFRVRRCAVQHLTLLTRLFRNPARVYESLIEANPVSLLMDHETSEDPLDIKLLAISVVKMSCGNPNALLSIGIFDLVKLFGSRHNQLNKLIIEKIVLSSLSALAEVLGYASHSHLLLINFGWLFHTWQEYAFQTIDDKKASQDELTCSVSLRFESFPLQMFYKTLMNTIDRTHVRKFIASKLRENLISVMIINACPRIRWTELIVLCKELDFPTHDSQVARLIQKSLCKIRALQVIFESSAQCSDSLEKKQDLSDLATYIDQFVNGTINATEIMDVLAKREFAFLLEVFTFSYGPPFPLFYRPTNLSDATTLLNGAVQNACNMLKGSSMEIICSKINYLAILAQMMNYANVCGLDAINVNFVGILKFLVQHTSILNHEVGVYYLLRLVHLVIQRFPSLTNHLMEFMQCISACLQKAPKIIISVWRMVSAEFIVLYYALQDQGNEISTSQLSPFLDGYFKKSIVPNVIHATNINSSLHSMIECFEVRFGKNMFCEKVIPLPKSCCDELFGSHLTVAVDGCTCLEVLKSYLNFQGTIAMVWLQLEYLRELFHSIESLDWSYDQRCELTELLINIRLHNQLTGLSPLIDDVITEKIVVLTASLGGSIKIESHPMHRLLLPFRSTQYDISNVTILLIELLFHQQFSQNASHFEVSSYTLSRLSSQKFFDHARELFMSNTFANGSLQCIRVNYTSFLEPGKFDIYEHLQCNAEQLTMIQRCCVDFVWNEDLWSQRDRTFSDWLSTLCFCLLQYLLDFVKKNDLTKTPGIEKHRILLMLMSVLSPVCLICNEICELLFPVIVNELIQLCGIQSPTTNMLSRHIATHLLGQGTSIKACKLGCDTLVFLLRQNIEGFKNGKLDDHPRTTAESGSNSLQLYSYYLSIDLGSAATAAIRCGSTSTALLLSEMFAEQCGASPNRSSQSPEGYKPDSLQATEQLKNLLMPIYRSVNDIDMIEGLDYSTDLYLQAECYANKSQWLQALSTYESMLCIDADNSTKNVSDGITRCMEELGANAFSQVPRLSNEIRGSAEQKLTMWTDMDEVLTNPTSINEFLSVVGRLEKLDYHTEGYLSLKKLCSKSVSAILPSYISEDMKLVNSNLGMVSDFAKLIVLVEDDYITATDVHVDSMNKFILGSISSQLRFQASNPAQILNIHRPLSVLSALARTKRLNNVDVVAPVKELCRGSMDLCHKLSPSLYGFWREMRNKTISQSNLLEDVLLQASIDLQQSWLLWGKGMNDASIHLISNVISSVSKQRENARKMSLRHSDSMIQSLDVLFAESMRTKGVWLSKRGSISPNDVLENYLKPALEGCKQLDVMIESAFAIAQFSSEMLTNLEEKVESSEWKMGMKVLHHREIEYKQCLALKPTDTTKAFIPLNGINIDVREFSRHMNMLKKEIDMDKKERTVVEASLISFLKSSLHHYGKVLQLKSKREVAARNFVNVDCQDVVFRLIGLWLNNSEKQEANEVMANLVPSISSHFFVPLTYQILSRLGLNSIEATNSSTTSNNGSFDGVLKQLVFAMCRDHPYHCLPQLFALINVTASLNSQVVKSNISMNRKFAAEEIFHQLRNAGGETLKTTTCMEKFLQNYIDLAVASTEMFHKAGKCKGIKFSDVQPRGKRFHELLESYPIKPPILTKDISISIIGQDYSTNGFVTRIVDIPPDFNITENGISRPKIIICSGDDGKSYRQLVKSGDDMRQDAVMEQVFRTVNQILRRYESTRIRQLHIRTYNVIPTTNQTGLLEWVENTAPIGMILVDKDTGLHNRYSVNDWKHIQCRDHLKNAVDNLDKEKRFSEIYANFHPVFRHFFLEKFSHPFDWLHRRLAYVHSVAANSITGYILGIGDRHAFNILIDTTTGEAVHIDFGIVFDQGKGLLTPETVPFRLTREIVDGMGITGCEGSFRRSCEEVLKVLRENAAHMLTILEVIIHDPLYKWSLSPFEAQLKQSKQKELGGGGTKLQLSAASPTPTPRKGGSKDGSSSKLTMQERERPPTPSFLAMGGMSEVSSSAESFGKEAAERTLLKIRNKLRGFENPTGEPLGVESHVDLLINEARNPFNLCKIFPGWAPWL